MRAMRSELPAPPTQNVWWIAVHGDSTCHVFTKVWFDARAIASVELGCDTSQIVPSLNDAILCGKDGSNA